MECRFDREAVSSYINYVSRFIGIGTHEIPESEKKETIKPCEPCV